MGKSRRKITGPAVASAEDQRASLRRVKRERDVLDRDLDQALIACRAAGASWAQLGRDLGVSPQGVQQRHARLVAHRTEEP